MYFIQVSMAGYVTAFCAVASHSFPSPNLYYHDNLMDRANQVLPSFKPAKNIRCPNRTGRCTFLYSIPSCARTGLERTEGPKPTLSYPVGKKRLSWSLCYECLTSEILCE